MHFNGNTKNFQNLLKIVSAITQSLKSRYFEKNNKFLYRINSVWSIYINSKQQGLKLSTQMPMSQNPMKFLNLAKNVSAITITVKFQYFEKLLQKHIRISPNIIIICSYVRTTISLPINGFGYDITHYVMADTVSCRPLHRA